MTATSVALPARLRPRVMVVALAGLAAAALASLTVGPAGIDPAAALVEVLDHLPFVQVDSGLTAREAAIVWELRAPRMVLGGMVGAMLAAAGAGYQGVFRNPLADPYLLGVAAGAGLGATLAIGYAEALPTSSVPVVAFVGGVVAVAVTYGMARAGGLRRTGTTMVLAGVAVASFFTALQTFVLQRRSDTIRQVFSWILGRLSTVGWGEVRVLLPYVVVAAVALLLLRRRLDVMAVGEEEAATLGVRPERVRAAAVLAATLGTAAAVAVSGLIGFVGIIVPHTVRLLVGASYRAILPVSLVAGAMFLMLADLLARSLVPGGELPIGVITAFVGAPFFAFVLWSSGRRLE